MARFANLTGGCSLFAGRRCRSVETTFAPMELEGVDEHELVVELEWILEDIQSGAVVERAEVVIFDDRLRQQLRRVLLVRER